MKYKPVSINELISNDKIYSVKDLAEGKCIVQNNGTFQQLKELLDKAYPNDHTNNLIDYWEYTYFGGINTWEFSHDKDSFGNIPVQSIHKFFDIEENNMNKCTVKELTLEEILDELKLKVNKMGLDLEIIIRNK